MNKLQIVLSTIILVSLLSCQQDPILDPMDVQPEPDYEVEHLVPTGDEKFLNTDSDYIFNQDKLHTFELNLPSSSLAELDADPTAEQYVEGTLTFEGEKISPVGIRYKGSVGAFINCLSDSDWSNPSGHKTCTKLSLKIKINWNGADTKFFGLKKLQFHSMNNDPSQLRERLGYWLFREMGVPAPRAVHARLLINGTYVGLFALIEQIDGRFTRYNFDDGKGNLYKEIWPITMNGQPHSKQTYLDHLETNKDENPTATLIQTFAQEVSNANDDQVVQVVSDWMDMDQMIRYAVVDRTIRNDDGAFHWYCGAGGCSPHNFYWYEETDKRRMHLIPWDLDHAFENIIAGANPVTPIADAWGEISANCEPFAYGFFNIQQRSAACDKITGAWASDLEEYERQVTKFKEEAFSAHQVTEVLEKWEAQIRAATLEAQDTHTDAISISEWEQAINLLKTQIDYARNL